MGAAHGGSLRGSCSSVGPRRTPSVPSADAATGEAVTEVSTIAIRVPATVVPIERISEFTPTPAPASEAGEFSRISVGMAA